MADTKLARRAHDALESNRNQIREIVNTAGGTHARALLVRAEADLVRRLGVVERSGAGAGSFTAAQLRATLMQVRYVLHDLTNEMRGTIVKHGDETAHVATEHVARYMREADRAFRGVGTQPLALREASMLSHARMGVQASILRRLASSGKPSAGPPHPAKIGILQRYGLETVKHFEKVLQRGLVAKKSWSEMREELREKSPFLRAAPAFWAQRIVRTEVMAAYAKSTHESMRAAHAQLGDVVKILSATFDDRTGADSYAVHGQIRRVEEPFEWWDGEYMHPPNRPNDREIVVSHRVAWEIPEYLEPCSEDEIAEAWARDGRKGAPPETPDDSTIPRESFGQGGSSPRQLASTGGG